MKVIYQYTREELMNLPWNEQPTPPIWPSRFYYYGILPAVFLVVAWVSSFGPAIVVLTLILFGGAFSNSQDQRLARQAALSERNMARYLEPITATIASQGMHSSHRHLDIFYRWPAFIDIRITDSLITFKLHSGDLMHIPIRAFASGEEARSFFDHAKRYRLDACQSDTSSNL